MVKYNDDQMTAIFHALADPTRRKILKMVARRERTASELSGKFDISFPAVSKHLRVLENADFIARRREGRTHRFKLNAETMKKASQWTEYFSQFWTGSLDKLDAYFENKKKEN